jgi:hypothetical protein
MWNFSIQECADFWRYLFFKKLVPDLNAGSRKTREDLTTMDKLHMALTELCYAINFSSTIK